jgi:hypothetical protein
MLSELHRTRLEELAMFFETGLIPPSATNQSEVTEYFGMGCSRGSAISEHVHFKVPNHNETCATVRCIAGFIFKFWSDDDYCLREAMKAVGLASNGYHYRYRDIGEDLFFPMGTDLVPNGWNASPADAAIAIRRAIELATNDPAYGTG